MLALGVDNGRAQSIDVMTNRNDFLAFDKDIGLKRVARSDNGAVFY
jgi:hypothetical protein